jgi:hypothetical protein
LLHGDHLLDGLLAAVEAVTTIVLKIILETFLKLTPLVLVAPLVEAVEELWKTGTTKELQSWELSVLQTLAVVVVEVVKDMEAETLEEIKMLQLVVLELY